MSAIWGSGGESWGRPLAVLTSYLALIAVIVALFSFVLPQVVESIRMLAGGLGGILPTSRPC